MQCLILLRFVDGANRTSVMSANVIILLKLHSLAYLFIWSYVLNA